MKTNTFLRTIMPGIFVLLMGFTAKSQNLNYTNNLSCDVTIAYEIRTGSCGNCPGGTFTLLAHTINGTIPLCLGAYDICIWITDVDGCTFGNNVPTGNHISLSLCHTVGSGWSGVTCSTAPNCPSTSFAISLLSISSLLVQ